MVAETASELQSFETVGEIKQVTANENDFLSNSKIAELLALAAEKAAMPLQKALRRASRKALLWPDEASALVQQGRSSNRTARRRTALESNHQGLDRDNTQHFESARNSEVISHPTRSTCGISKETYFTICRGRTLSAHFRRVTPTTPAVWAVIAH
jgi:hypothetical protein